MRIIKWLLRTSFYGFFLLPFISWAAIYGFVALAMITLGTTNLWPTDPKTTPLGEDIHDAVVALMVFGLFLYIPLLIYLTVDFFMLRFNLQNRNLICFQSGYALAAFQDRYYFLQAFILTSVVI